MGELPDYDDPEVEAAWTAEQHTLVEQYLTQERVPAVQVARDPAWIVAPYVAIWRVLAARSGQPSYWAISGDLPTDFIPADTRPDARTAVAGFAERWQAVARYMARGAQHPTVQIGTGGHGPELAALLASRAALLAQWAASDEYW